MGYSFNESKYVTARGRFHVCDSNLFNSLHQFVGPHDVLNILEIGSYEGSSACFFSDNVLDNPLSTLECVDPFDTSDPMNSVYKNMELCFKYNVSKSKNAAKITLHKDYSNNYFKNNKKTYNFIYVDGSHLDEDIESDMENSFRFLRKHGIMWMDDYLGGETGSIKRTMDKFLEKHRNEIIIILSGYQIAIRKIID